MSKPESGEPTDNRLEGYKVSNWTESVPLFNVKYNNLILESQGIEFQYSPAVLLKPKLTIDGDMWCALFGENLQDGVAGFGASPAEAYTDFNAQWAKRLPAKVAL